MTIKITGMVKETLDELVKHLKTLSNIFFCIDDKNPEDTLCYIELYEDTNTFSILKKGIKINDYFISRFDFIEVTVR